MTPNPPLTEEQSLLAILREHGWEGTSLSDVPKNHENHTPLVWVAKRVVKFGGLPATLTLGRRLLEAGVDVNATRTYVAGEQAVHPNILGTFSPLRPWLPLLVEFGLDLAWEWKPDFTALNMILRVGGIGGTSEKDLDNILALMEAGLVPTPDTGWGRAFLDNLPKAGGWANPVREWLLAKKATDLQVHLQTVFPEGAGKPLEPSPRLRL